MRAITLREHGDSSKLVLERLPDPSVGAGQVRVRVRACALNHLDIWVRRGLPNLKLSYPHILGSDIAGEVDQCGAGVTDLTPGQKALVAPGVSCGYCPMCLAGRDNFCKSYGILGESCDGGYAEFVVVPRANILPYPENLSFEEAAALPLCFQTAWQMLVDRAQIITGETVLVLAAGSGVGTAAIQIAKLHGCHVIAAASTDDKLYRAKALGADDVVNYNTADLTSQIRSLTNKRGVDVVVEQTGASTWASSIACCTYGGRIVTCGATSGYEAQTDLRHVFFRQISILGSTMGSKAALYRVLQFVKKNQLKPIVDRTMPLQEAATAQKLLEERAVFGKVVLTY